MIGNGWPLREIRLEHATLEEFFVQVTANQAMATVADHARRREAEVRHESCSRHRSPRTEQLFLFADCVRGDGAVSHRHAASRFTTIFSPASRLPCGCSLTG